MGILCFFMPVSTDLLVDGAGLVAVSSTALFFFDLEPSSCEALVCADADHGDVGTMPPNSAEIAQARNKFLNPFDCIIYLPVP